MKKFLSLVLALTMALSLVTVSAGATDFGDDGDITYQEAVTVIAGMGIVDGYSDGSFRPDDVLTRGAAAKIICNLILGPTTADALSASSAPFVDVPTTNTFAGYITYCSQQGIISGYADGTFRPTDTLSGNAFMKMLLGALGYDSEREGYTGSNWTVNVIKQAVGIGLDDGNDDFVGSQAVTRQEACLYAFNTLKATMVEYSDNSTVTVGDITISSQGDYSDVTNGTSSDGNIEDDGLMQFAERYFRDLEAEDDTDDFGRPATTWTYDGDELGTYANDADATYVVGDTEDTLGTLVTDDACLDYSASDVLSNADVFYNGKDLGTYSSNRDAVYVVYAAENLKGGASSSDVVYLADDANNAVGSGNYEVDLYFMEDMSLVEDLTIDAKEDQGFYDYEVDEDGVYTLTTDEVEFIDDDVNDDTDDEADESVAFVEVYNYLASTVSSGYFDAVSFADAVVIDTRSSSDRNDDVYDNEINTASKLSTAIDRIMDDDIEDGEVVADVYVQDGEIVFVAVTDVADGEPDEDEENQNADFDEVELAKNGNLTFYDDDGDQITLTGEHDWELWWLSASDWVRTGYGDDYVYGEDNPWKDEWDSGERYYVVIDGVESNIVTAD